MSSAGIDNQTGKQLRGFDHVAQSLRVLFSTRIGSRVMRRLYGSRVPELLGENYSKRTVLRFFVAIIVAIELWEPRFRVRRIAVPSSKNSPEGVRMGDLRFSIFGEYRPRGHLGDPTPEIEERVFTL